MKLTVNKNDIIDVLSKIQGIAGHKTSLAITETVLIKATTGLSLTVTDLETGFEGNYPAQVESQGEAAINARKLYEIVKDFPVDDIIIEETENQWFKIGNETVQYNIVGMLSSDFPEVPVIEELEFFKIDSRAFKSMIDKSLVIGALNDNRAHVRGVLFETINNIARIISTDGGRLSTAESEIETEMPPNLTTDVRVLIPKKALNEVSKFLKDGFVHVGVKHNEFIVKKDAETFIIRLLEGEYPDYKSIVAKTDEHVVTADKKLFLGMLKRMAILSSDSYKGAVFNFSDGKLIVTTTNPDIGESKEEIAIDFKGEPLAVSFNTRYFIETLGAIGEDRILINIVNAESPCIIEGENDKSFLSVIMPMRLNE